MVTDKSAFVWLMSLSDPKHLLARWIMEVQSIGFMVEYERADGILLSVPHTLSCDTMDGDQLFCHRRLEAVSTVEEGRREEKFQG